MHAGIRNVQRTFSMFSRLIRLGAMRPQPRLEAVAGRFIYLHGTSLPSESQVV